jgi:putative tryptophan/tyrosine transport system substrate-binding protein
VLGSVARPEGRRMRRREFIALSMGAAVHWPFVARAQQPAFPVIGFLSGASFEAMHDYVSVFKQSLAEAGFVGPQRSH